MTEGIYILIHFNIVILTLRDALYQVCHFIPWLSESEVNPKKICLFDITASIHNFKCPAPTNGKITKCNLSHVMSVARSKSGFSITLSTNKCTYIK